MTPLFFGPSNYLTRPHQASLDITGLDPSHTSPDHLTGPHLTGPHRASPDLTEHILHWTSLDLTRPIPHQTSLDQWGRTSEPHQQFFIPINIFFTNKISWNCIKKLIESTWTGLNNVEKSIVRKKIRKKTFQFYYTSISRIIQWRPVSSSEVWVRWGPVRYGSGEATYVRWGMFPVWSSEAWWRTVRYGSVEDRWGMGPVKHGEVRWSILTDSLFSIGDQLKPVLQW